MQKKEFIKLASEGNTRISVNKIIEKIKEENGYNTDLLKQSNDKLQKVKRDKVLFLIQIMEKNIPTLSSDLNDIILIGRKIRGSKAYKSYVEERGNVQIIKSYSANYIYNF